ncbi:hypothetical protein CPB83DRAFT_422945 [Crepidotus variabilis]|uniref:Uncharacterized protein n=1 Tax=Crepidotus variabilis TaxID=179855 RepID=A0A9P6EQB1_9AGAR|nr:hypothetical protein CPB83DRAFT_422945 [Crepidotus variabilis]
MGGRSFQRRRDEPDGTTQEHQALETRRTLKKRESYPHIRDKGKARARAVVAQDADYQRGPDFNSWASLEGVEDAMYAGGYGGRGVVQEDDDEDELAQEEYEGEEEDEEMEMEIFEDALEPIEEEPDLEEQANERDRLSGLIASATSFDPKEHQPSSRYYHQNHIDDQQQYESSALDTYSKPSDHEGPLISGDATESTTPTMTLTPASSMMLLKNPLTTTTTTDPIPPLPAGAAQPARSASFALNISTSMNGTSTTGTSTPTLAPGTPASKLTPLRRVPKSRSGSSLRQMRVGGSRESLRDRMGTVGSKRSPKVSRERLRTPKGSKEGLRTPTGSREGLRETRRSEISTNGKASRKEEKKRKTLMKPRSAKSSVIGTSSSTLKGKERESQPELSRGRSQSKPSSSKKPVKKPSQASLRATRRPTSSSSTPKTFLGSLRMSLLRPIHLVFGTNRRRLSKELRTPNTLVQNRRFSEKYIPRFPSRLDGIRGVEKRVAKYE